jgi:hypothetical protein
VGSFDRSSGIWFLDSLGSEQKLKINNKSAFDYCTAGIRLLRFVSYRTKTSFRTTNVGNPNLVFCYSNFYIRNELIFVNKFGFDICDADIQSLLYLYNSLMYFLFTCLLFIITNYSSLIWYIALFFMLKLFRKWLAFLVLCLVNLFAWYTYLLSVN